jgi:hypothetical protein
VSPNNYVAPHPGPAVPGLPLEAPSKLILMKCAEGGDQVIGLICIGLLILGVD